VQDYYYVHAPQTSSFTQTASASHALLHSQQSSHFSRCTACCAACRLLGCLQDYYYVRGFTPFAGSLLASAPDSHLETIVSGIAALTDELAWFKETAQKRGCDVTIIGGLGEGWVMC
jgi:hypothetical protein